MHIYVRARSEPRSNAHVYYMYPPRHALQLHDRSRCFANRCTLSAHYPHVIGAASYSCMLPMHVHTSRVRCLAACAHCEHCALGTRLAGEQQRNTVVPFTQALHKQRVRNSCPACSSHLSHGMLLVYGFCAWATKHLEVDVQCASCRGSGCHPTRLLAHDKVSTKGHGASSKGTSS